MKAPVLFNIKKLFISALVGAIGTMVLPSCHKEVIQTESIKELTIDTTISINSTFNFDLSGVYTPSKTVAILQQAEHYKTSSIETVEDTNDPYYTYTSSLQSPGTDKVVLSVANRYPTAGNDSTIIYINLTVR